MGLEGPPWMPLINFMVIGPLPALADADFKFALHPSIVCLSVSL